MSTSSKFAFRRKRLFCHKSNNYQKVLRELNDHKIPFEYPPYILNNMVFFFMYDISEGIKGVSGFVRVFRKWTNPLAKFIGDRKVLEVMAGNGMLAYTLKQRGIDIIATDNIAWKRFCTKNPWPISIENIDAIQAIEKYGEKIDFLLMAWPLYDDSTAYRCVEKLYKVNPEAIVIYIGEWGGCTADDAFFNCIEVLKDGYFEEQVVKRYRNFAGLHDQPFLVRYNCSAKF